MGNGISSWWLQRNVERLLEEDRLAEAVEHIRRKGAEKEGALLLAELGHAEAAMELLVSVGQHRQAGRVGAAAGRYLIAARHFEAAGDFQGAARAFEKAGDQAGALRLHARLGDGRRVTELASAGFDPPLVQAAVEFLLSRSDLDEAVALLRAASRPDEAGTLLERAGRMDDALQLYQEAGLEEAGALVLEQQGSYQSAAALLFRVGQHYRAAQVLARGGDAMQAARLLQRLERPEEALQTLDSVGPSAPDYVDVTILAASLLEQMGDFVQAERRFADLLERIGYSPQNEETIYRLVDVRMKLGDVRGAEQALERAGAEGGDVTTLTGQITAIREASSGVTGVAGDSPGSSSVTTSFRLPKSSRYKLASPIAAGFHGEIYLVRDVKLDREVVLKILHASSLPSGVARDYFKREYRAIATLNHPNIVELFEFGELGGRLFYAMEYVQGHNLLEVLDGNQPRTLSHDEKVSICTQICSALSHAHERRILHRDVKLDNVMVTPDLHVKLLDFGIAKALDENPHASQFILGTPSYMSPEQIAGRSLDGRTDIYSLGVLMFRLYTGKKPFDTAGEMRRRIMPAPPPDPRRHAPEIPGHVAESILRCLEFDPEARFSTAAEVAAALAAAPE